MPRKPRLALTGYAHHVTNRGNDRRQLFFQAGDYREFLQLMIEGRQRYDVTVFGLCIMPNHVHALIKPNKDDELSAYLQWVLGRYACNYRSNTRTVGHGHVFQRRYWSDVIRDERHFLSVLRYIEANPVRAGLVPSAERWPWSSMSLRPTHGTLLDPAPFELGAAWLELVNAPQRSGELDQIRNPSPLGTRVYYCTVKPAASP
jgi:putative transposase